MEKLAVEQKIDGTTYQPAGQSASQQATSIGGFAYSFEELLQRVGARLEHAFSAADQSSGLLNSSSDPAPKEPVRESTSSSDNPADRDHGGHDTADNEAPRPAASDERGGGNDQRADANTSDRNDSASSDRGDNGGQDHAARDTDNGGRENSGNDSDTGDQTAKSDNTGGTSDQDGNTGDQAGQAANAGTDNAANQQASANQAAALYAAGIVGGQAQTNVNTTDTTAQQQSSAADDGLQTAAAVLANNGAKKATTNTKAQNNHGSAAQSANADAGAQKATENTQTGKSDALQNQAQQLSRAIGNDTRANINVSVSNESAQVTSKPTLTVANASILTQDGASTSQNNGQGQANTQQQGNNGQNTQQLQAAALQQAQAAQQAAAQNAQVVTGTGSGTTGSGTGGVQAAGGGAQHAGGGEGLNNTNQSANANQQSQQNQQTRETQPQQQAQQAQRNAAQGGSITDQISVKITKALQAGTDRISIQLKPAELGRVDVKMEMTQDGRVMTVVTAEKQDTLDLLRRDSSELQRALAEAGLQTGDMEFNLKGQEQQTAEGENDGSVAANADDDADATETDDGDGVVSAWESGIFLDGRVDMRA